MTIRTCDWLIISPLSPHGLGLAGFQSLIIRRVSNVIENAQENALKAFHAIGSSWLSCKQIENGMDRMKRHEASKLLRGFKQAFSDQTGTAIGRSTGFLKREREMTPMKVMVSLLSRFAGGEVLAQIILLS